MFSHHKSRHKHSFLHALGSRLHKDGHLHHGRQRAHAQGSDDTSFRDGRDFEGGREPSGMRGHGRGGLGRGGRFGGGRGFGGRGFGGRGNFGDEGFARGRKLSSDELQLIIEALLHEQPAHGYELIRRLEERSGGFYKPSPGMIYPALTYLEDASLASVSQDGNRKLYALTEAGTAHFEANREEAERILDMLTRIGARMAEVRDALAGVDDLDPTLGNEFHEARRALKRALLSRRGCDAGEMKRIVGILRQAAADILGSTPRSSD